MDVYLGVRILAFPQPAILLGGTGKGVTPKLKKTFGCARFGYPRKVCERDSS